MYKSSLDSTALMLKKLCVSIPCALALSLSTSFAADEQPYYDDGGAYYDDGSGAGYSDNGAGYNDGYAADGYAQAPAPVQEVAPEPQEERYSLDDNKVIEIEAIGIGVAPDSCTPAHAVALAKRAAIVDAYRQLGEQMYGLKLDSNETVRNMVLRNSNIKTRVSAIIRGAQVRESSCAQGICQVTMELKLDSKAWSGVLSNAF